MTALRELERAATPGPWRWAGRVGDPMITTVGRGMVYVMGFERSGMRGGQPTFQVYGRDERPGAGRMVKARELAVRQVPYRDDIVDIDHPDAHLLIAARNALPLLLDVVDAARFTLAADATHREPRHFDRLAAALAALDAEPLP